MGSLLGERAPFVFEAGVPIPGAEPLSRDGTLERVVFANVSPCPVQIRQRATDGCSGSCSAEAWVEAGAVTRLVFRDGCPFFCA